MLLQGKVNKMRSVFLARHPGCINRKYSAFSMRTILSLLFGCVVSFPAWSNITLSLDGDVNGPVSWNVPSASETNTRLFGGGSPRVYAELGYNSPGYPNSSEPAGMQAVIKRVSGAQGGVSLGFIRGGNDGQVVVTLPTLSCSVEYGGSSPHPEYNIALSVSDSAQDASSLTRQLQASVPVTWYDGQMDGGSLWARTGSSEWSDPPVSGTTKFSGDSGARVYAGKNALPGTYTLSIPVQCKSAADLGDGFQYPMSTLSQQITLSFSLEAAPSSCSLAPPDAVDFGSVLASKDSVLLASRDVSINASCRTSNGSDDIGRAMYLSFVPGSNGLYGDDIKKLGTSLGGIYITGGSSAGTADCTSSDMQFDNQTQDDVWQLGVIEPGGPDVPTVKDRSLYFSLCHDTRLPLTPGNMTADMGVNLVIK